MDIDKAIKMLEDLREEFEYDRKEYANPGSYKDPYEYGVWAGKEEAYEDAKFRLDEIILKLKAEQ